MRILESLRGLLFILTVVVSTVIFGSTVLLLYPFTFWYQNRSHLHYIGVVWAKAIIAMNPKWEFEVEGREHLSALGTPVIYVANHVSQTDILAAFCIGMDFKWLSKHSVFQVPILGWAMTAAGYVPVKRGDKASHKNATRMARHYLTSGTSMFYFPEGTRSPTGRIQKFKLGAFQLAFETKVPVVPITLEGTERLLPKGSWAPGHAHVKVRVHPALEVQPEEDIQSFANRVFDVMNEYLPEHMKALS